MPYKLLVNFILDVEPQLKALIGTKDAVRGEPCTFSFSATNIGTEKFPGGKLQSLRIDYNGGSSQIWSDVWDCPALTVEETKNIMKLGTIPVTEGLAWVSLSIQSVDSLPVELYQSRGSDVIPPAWKNCFYIVNREILLMLVRLSSK